MKKNPFNWAGNKYKHMELVNSTIKDNYDSVYDIFMGSGNIAVNIDSETNKIIGNDIIPLLPNVYKAISEEKSEFTLEEILNIISRWDNFSDKSYYYEFRDIWNNKYIDESYDREFIYETVLLLKMCSNSMVRFNKTTGRFNQGFRGLAGDKKVFFSKVFAKRIVRELNEFQDRLHNKTFEFHSKDFKSLLSMVGPDDLVILDPPYILSQGLYGADFTKEDDQAIFDFLANTEADFILFNYLESNEETHEVLKKFLIDNKGLSVELISETSATGQSTNDIKKVKEVMIHNITLKESIDETF